MAFADGISAQEGQTFEAGIAQAMTAVLASPRFLFREESASRGFVRTVSGDRRICPRIALVLLPVVVHAR